MKQTLTSVVLVKSPGKRCLWEVGTQWAELLSCTLGSWAGTTWQRNPGDREKETDVRGTLGVQAFAV